MKNRTKINLKLCAVLFLTIGFFVFNAQGQNDGRMPVTVSSKQIQQLYTKSLAAMEKGDTKQAILLLNEALDLDSTFFMGNFQLLLYEIYFDNKVKMNYHIMLALKNSGKLGSGEQHLYQALAQLKDKPEISLMYALKKLTEMYPNDKEVWYMLGALQIINQQYIEALETYAKLLDKTDNPAAVYNRIGYIHMFLGNYEKAESAFNKYIELNPEHPNSWDSKGDFFMEIMEFEEAYNCYMRAFSLNTHWSRDKAMKAKWKSISRRY